MQDQVLVQFNNYLRIAHHRHHLHLHSHFPVFYHKREEQEEQSHDVAPNVAPNVAQNTLANINIRLHFAFQFSAFHSRKIEVYISDKCIYRKKIQSYQIIKTSKRLWPITCGNFSTSLLGWWIRHPPRPPSPKQIQIRVSTSRRRNQRGSWI